MNVVFVGFPVRWYAAPTIINTFLEGCDFTGKMLVPFAASGGSGTGRTNGRLAPSCPGAKLLDGAVLPASDKAVIKSWAEKMSTML